MIKIQIEFNESKYKALQRYADKKEVSIDEKLIDTVEKLYNEFVPKDVREYIEESDSKVVKKPKKPRKIKQAEEKEQSIPNKEPNLHQNKEQYQTPN